MNPLRTPQAIPGWLKDVAPDSLFNSRDVAKLFDITPGNVIQGIRRGYFPAPDKTQRDFSGRERYFWRPSTLVAEIKQRNAANANH